MAYVSSFSSKKLPSFSSHGFSSSSSSRHIYDGVFGSSNGSNKVNSSGLCSFSDDDYGEIFGSSKFGNGAWESSCCSIPVVELPVSEQRVRGVRGLEMDYCGVFGGVCDEKLSVPNGEEFFDQLKKKAKISTDTLPSSRSKEQTKEATRSHISSQSQNVQASMSGFSKSIDGVKHHKQKTNSVPSNETNGARPLGHFCDTSGSTCTLPEVAPQETPVIKADTEIGIDTQIRGKHSRNSSSNLGVEKQKSEHNAGNQRAPVLSELNSAATALDTHQPTIQTNGASHEVDSSQKAQMSRTPVIKADTELEMDINLATKGKHSRQSSSDIGVNEHKSEHDAGFRKAPGSSSSNSAATLPTAQPSKAADDAEVAFDAKDNVRFDGLSHFGATKQNSEIHDASQKASGLSRSSSVAASFDTRQDSGKSRSPKVVEDAAEVPTAFNAGKKQGRHSRMTSLDLGARRQANDHDAVGFQRKSRLGGSHSFDASHDPFAARIKVQPSKVVPSSSQPHFFPIESHYKISENSNSSSSLPSLDDQLDLNSLAAISAAALQRAMEEAEMRIRLAKEFLEREGRGSTKLSFKDTLKVKVMKENKHVNEMNNVTQKKNVVEDRSQVRHLNEMNNVRQKKNVVEEDRSAFERESVLETAQFAPVLVDHKQFPEEFIKRENVKTPKSIEEPQECKKNEAGEWEATKHLNQLITGVKNKIASFMTWQVETEKKEEPKEVEPIIKPPHVSEYSGCEPLETDKSQHVTICADKMEIEENTVGLCPPDNELEESEFTRDNTKEQEKVGDIVDITPDIEGPTTTNFLFFTFNSGRSGDRPHPEEAENYESQGSAESGTENRQEELVDEVMNEQIHSNDTKANLEALHDVSVSQDCGESLIHSINEEFVEKIKECNPMAEHDTSKFIHEEDNEWELNEEPGDDSELSQEAIASGTKEELAGDCAMDEGHQNDSVMNEEHGIDGIESTHEEDDGRRVKEGSGDDRSALAHEVGNGTKVNEECGDDTDTSIHEEDNDRMVYEEHGDDRSRFADEVENRMLTEEHGEAPIDNSHYPENIVHRIEKDDDEQNEIKVVKEDEEQHDNAQLTEEANLVGAAGKIARATGERYESIENERDQCSIDHVEEVCGQMNGVEEDKGYQSQANHVETTKKEAEQASCMTVDDKCWQMEDVVLSKPEEVVCRIDGSNLGAETVFPVEDDEKIMEISDSSLEFEVGIETTAPLDEGSEEQMEKTNHSSEPEVGVEHPVLSRNANECIGEERVLTSVLTEHAVEFDGIEHLTDVDATFPCENSVLHECETDVNCRQKDVIDGKETELKPEDILENQTKNLHESGKTVDTEAAASVSDLEAEKCNVEAVHRRRRWFENGEKVGAAERPMIHEGGGTNLVVDQDALEESDLAGSVEIHADKLDGDTAEVLIREADTVLNHEDSQVNVEATHKRRRWFVNRGEVRVPEPPSLFEGIKVTSEIDHEIANEPMPQNTSDECVDKASSESGDTVVFSETDEVAIGEKDKPNVEATPRRKRWFESVEKVGPAQNVRSHEDDRMTVEINQEHEVGSDTEKHSKLGNIPAVEEKNDVPNNVEPVKESHRDLDAANRRKKEKEKERIAVERAIREARERAFAEARERARRDAVERPNKATCQKAGSGDQDRQGKVSAETSSSGDKALMEAKLRAERAAVERATAEVRERALQKALSEKAFQRSREQLGRHPAERSSSLDPKYNLSSYYRCSDSSNNGEKSNGADGESAQRCKARLERQKRTVERAAKALEEKNKRDLLVQKEQAARNMLADTLDAEVKRWSSGKEGNVRALLSTLQYILGSDSGWQAISLTDLVAPTAVRKAYKKATLCVHPDKLQQRGASIQQKYICEKVFDLLKDAWSRFNPDDR